MTPDELEQHRKYLKGGDDVDFPGLARVGEALLAEVDALREQVRTLQGQLDIAVETLAELSVLLQGVRASDDKEASTTIPVLVAKVLAEVRTLTAERDEARRIHASNVQAAVELAEVFDKVPVGRPVDGVFTRARTLLAERDDLKARLDTALVALDAAQAMVGDFRGQRDALRARVAELEAALRTANDLKADAMDKADTARDAALEEGKLAISEAFEADEDIAPQTVLEGLKAQPARRFVEAERVAELLSHPLNIDFCPSCDGTDSVSGSDEATPFCPECDEEMGPSRTREKALRLEMAKRLGLSLDEVKS